MERNENESKFRKTLDSLIEEGARYADIRSSDSSVCSMMHKNGKLEDVSTGDVLSIGVRVLYKGSWGFVSGNDISRLGNLARDALKIARSMHDLNGDETVSLSKEDTIDKDLAYKYRCDLDSVSIDDRIRLMEAGYKGASEGRPEIGSVSQRYQDARSEVTFANSEGSYITSSPQYCCYSVLCNSRRGERAEASYDNHASFLGFDDMVKADTGKLAAGAAQRALDLLDAKSPPSGKMPVILHPSIVGLFVHEAVGHASEADSAERGSILRGMIGKRLGPDFLDIIDDPSISGKHGFFRYDSEGVKAQKTQIIKDGMFRSYMHSRETAGRMGVRSTGNARAQSPLHQPIVRMSNTYLGNGDHSLDEMFCDTKDGIYMKGSKGGQVNTVDGTFTFGAEMGYMIKDGKKRRLVKDCSISGHILDVLKNVEAVSDDLDIDGTGFCGKDGQAVPVSDGGPHMKVKEMVVGGKG